MGNDTTYATPGDVIERWPSLAEFGRAAGVTVSTAWKWKARGKIPAKYDAAIVEAAAQRGVDVSFEDLARMRSAA